MISNDERLSAYNASGAIILPIEKNILEICNDEVTQDYLKQVNVAGGLLYECSSIAVYGTEYKKGHYIILPNSTNSKLIFGKIVKLLCCEKFCYLLYQTTSSYYCENTDLYFVEEKENFEIIPSHQLGDFHPLEGYSVGEGKEISLSIKHYLLENDGYTLPSPPLH